MSFVETGNRSMAHILLRLDLREGLVEKNNLQLQDYSYTQLIDYDQLPFRCHVCHKYGHLVQDCPLGFRRRRRHRGDPRSEDQSQAEVEEMVQTKELGNQQESEHVSMEIQDDQSVRLEIEVVLEQDQL